MVWSHSAKFRRANPEPGYVRVWWPLKVFDQCWEGGVCPLRHCVICEGRRGNRMLWGRWKTGSVEDYAVGKEGLQEILELLGDAPF